MQFPSKTLLVCGLVLSVSASSSRADDSLRKVQQALHDQGFYYGTIDGSPGDETTQAVRRYQIRNGLAVTGQLNDETLKSIAKAGPAAPTKAPDKSAADDRRYANTPGPAAPAPPRQPPPPVINGDDGGEDDADAAPPPQRPPSPRQDLRVAPGAVRPSSSLMNLFAGTPYEFAPPPVQADLLRRAQFRLLRSGFYGGEPDGVPGEATSSALSEFQSANGMRRTGRLTPDTLAALRLEAPPRRPPPIAPGGVYEGRVVR